MKSMKFYRYMLTAVLVSCGVAAALTSCSDDDPFFTATENDAPRILNTDIPEWSDGEPGTLMSIDRATNFTFDVVTTPKRYTTVEWFLDGEKIFEGDSIDIPLLAGDHLLKIVATTTKGLSTSRTTKLIVRPLAGDPALATDDKSRWLTIGETKTVGCTNTTDVKRVFVGKKEATNVSFSNDQLTFDVPSMDEGQYMVTIEDASGNRYGCNWFTVSNSAYVDPGIKETVLWEGDVDIDWGDANVFISAEEMSYVPVGATVRLVYEMIDAEYHALRVTNQDWTKDIVPQIDSFDAYTSPYEFTFTADHKAIADEKGMLVTGFGYKLTKVMIVEGVAPAEITLWEGDTDINWGDVNVFVSVDDMAAAPVGATIHLYHEIIDAEYHALRVTNQDWTKDIVPQVDGFDAYTSPYEFTYTEDHKAIADEKGMLVTGFGYKLTKVTFTK